MGFLFTKPKGIIFCLIKFYSEFTDSIQVCQHYKGSSIAVYCSASCGLY